MHPKTIIELGIIFGVLVAVSLLVLLTKRQIRKYIWGFVVIVFIIVSIFYTTRPFIVDAQTSKAIGKLEDFLSSSYPKEIWNITHTDDYELKSLKMLHVVFNNELNIVYEYGIEGDCINQTGFWGKVTGDSPQKLLEQGIVPKHIE